MTSKSSPAGTATSATEDYADVATWIRSIIPDVEINSTLSTEPNDAAEPSVDLVVVEVTPVADQRTDRKLPTRLDVTYLAAPVAAGPTDAADMVIDLIAACREQVHCSVASGRMADSWWAASNRTPRPHVVLNTLLVLAPPVDNRTGPPVLEPLRVVVGAAAGLSGFVVREGRPLRSAVVRLIATGDRTETDRRGYFAFPNVPNNHPAPITIRSNGTTFSGVVPAGATTDVRIECTPEPILERQGSVT